MLIIGIINTISTSKIKKMIAIKKNRREKGIREEDLGSNPHSNGDLFSRSVIDFFDKYDAKNIIIVEIIIITKDTIIIIKIIYIKNFKPYNWKLYILLYYINNYLPHQ